MYGRHPEDEPAGESYRRMPPRRGHPRDDFDGRRDFGTGHPREDPGGDRDYTRSRPRGSSGYDHYFERPASAAMPGTGSKRRPASDHLRSAGRRVGHALGWFGVLVIAPLVVGIVAGAIGQHIGL